MVGMGSPYVNPSVCIPVPATEMSDWTFHTSGLWVQILIEHKTLSFCRPFTFILIGAQHICDASSVKEYPGNLRVQGIIFLKYFDSRKIFQGTV